MHGDEVRVVTGHFPLCTVDLLGGAFTTFTVLREPGRADAVAAAPSTEAERAVPRTGPRGRSTATTRLHDIIRNHMVKMLSLTVDEVTSTPLVAAVEFDDARLERRDGTWRDRMDVFGLQEHFDEFCAELDERFGWDLGPPRFANRTQRASVQRGTSGRGSPRTTRSTASCTSSRRQLWDERRPHPDGDC